MNNDLEIRAVNIENVDHLIWPKCDQGAFGVIKDGIPYDGPIADWYFDSKSFMEMVKNFDTVIQAGGNCGMYPRFYSNYFKNVYTFEPDQLNYSCLLLNCNNDHKYFIYFGALGENLGNGKLVKGCDSNIGTHSVKFENGDVKIYTIDDLNLKSCDLIHLDIEGAEETALKGALETIEKYSPVIITERAGGEALLL